MLFTVLSNAGQVQHLEDTIQTYYMVAMFTLALLTTFCIALSGAVFRVMSNVRKNAETIGILAHATNGKMDEMKLQVAELRTHVTTDTPVKGTDNATTTPAATDSTAT